jgi:hypothetical protein
MGSLYTPGQLIRFRRKVSLRYSEYFDLDWVYAICLEVNSDGIAYFSEQGSDEWLNIGSDDIEPVKSLDDIPPGETGHPQHQREIFIKLANVLEERIRSGKSLLS